MSDRCPHAKPVWFKTRPGTFELRCAVCGVRVKRTDALVSPDHVPGQYADPGHVDLAIVAELNRRQSSVEDKHAEHAAIRGRQEYADGKAKAFAREAEGAKNFNPTKALTNEEGSE